MSNIMEWMRRLWYLVNRRRLEEALQQEMDAHRQLMQDVRRFGNPLRIREAARDVWGWNWLDHIVRDASLASRALRRSPGFTIAAVSSLALGLALVATTMAVVNAYLIRSLPYPAAERLYHVMYAPPGPWEPAGMALLDWKSVDDVVEHTITSSGETYYLSETGYAQPARGLRVSRGFVTALDARAVLGRTLVAPDFTTSSDRVAVLGYSLWRTRFGGDSAILGRTLRVETERQESSPELLRIVGVLRPDFYYGRDSRDRVDILVPLQSSVQTYMVRLRAGVPVSLAEHRITEAARAVGSPIPADWSGVRLESAHGRYVSGLRPLLVAMTLAAGLVLAVVCANVAVLVLLRATRRQKEFAVRVALGAGRGHLVRMLAIETCLICGAALAVGLAQAAAGLRLLAPLVEEHLGRPAPGGTLAISMDSLVLLLIGGAGAVVALSLACVPLLIPWQRRLADALRRESRGGTDAPAMRRTRATLIALEVGISLALLAGCGLMVRSAINLVRVDRGFVSDQVMRSRVAFPGWIYPDATALIAFYDRLAERISASTRTPLAFASWPPFVETPKQLVSGESGAGSVGGVHTGVLAVSAGYFTTLHIERRLGRDVAAGDKVGSEPVALVSEALARRLWSGESAIDRRIRVTGESPGAVPSPWLTVIGVVRDVRQSYADDDLSDVYTAFLQAPPNRYATFYFTSVGRGETWTETLRRVVAEVDPRVMVSEVRSLVSDDRELSDTTFMTWMLVGFAVFAALLAALGIYGVTAYAAEQREREVAIRVALGATRSAVVRMFLREGGVVLVTGLAIGLVGANVVARVLAAQIHGVQVTDAFTLLTACTLMTWAGLMATGWPAVRAASKSPLPALNET